MARPPKYNKEILTSVREYINSCQTTYEVKQRPLIKNGKEQGSEDFRVEKTKVPTLEGLAFYLKVHKDTIQDWKKKFKEFSLLIDELLAKQADELINKGLSGEYSHVIAKVLLTKHGYREGTDVTSDDKPILEGVEITIRK